MRNALSTAPFQAPRNGVPHGRSVGLARRAAADRHPSMRNTVLALHSPIRGGSPHKGTPSPWRTPDD
nr:MAG TPA: hypothetical protein [Caudoviricetes sp.]